MPTWVSSLLTTPILDSLVFCEWLPCFIAFHARQLRLSWFFSIAYVHTLLFYPLIHLWLSSSQGKLCHWPPLKMSSLRTTIICPWLIIFISLAFRHQVWRLSFDLWYFTLSFLECI
ncbi:hypothetical protein EDB85DRAFT_1972727 [Lactarius pseudohatsudake]|nr:hypothetical protein EDB85DRAFT_1972727 [Lactarius pseudohatsudake]